MAKPSSVANFMGDHHHDAPLERRLLRSQTLVESMHHSSINASSSSNKNPHTSTIGSRFQQKNLIGINDPTTHLMMKQRNSIVGDADRVVRTSQRTESGSSASSSRRSSIDQHGNNNGFIVVGSGGRKYTISGSSTNSNYSSSNSSKTPINDSSTSGKMLKNNFINTSKVYKQSRSNEKPMFY